MSGRSALNYLTVGPVPVADIVIGYRSGHAQVLRPALSRAPRLTGRFASVTYFAFQGMPLSHRLGLAVPCSQGARLPDASLIQAQEW